MNAQWNIRNEDHVKIFTHKTQICVHPDAHTHTLTHTHT